MRRWLEERLAMLVATYYAAAMARAITALPHDEPSLARWGDTKRAMGTDDWKVAVLPISSSRTRASRPVGPGGRAAPRLAPPGGLRVSYRYGGL